MEYHVYADENLLIGRLPLCYKSGVISSLP